MINTGIINPEAHMTRGMFDWTDDEIWTFYLENIGKITPNLDVIEGAKEYIEKLKKDGHTIVIITGRDFIVKAQDLQYGYVEDVSKMYKVNDKIKVIIKEKSEENKSIKISVKDLLEDPFKNIRKDFTEKGEYLATITGYTDNGIFANIAQGVDTVCILPTWLDRPPFPGEKVIIKIYKIIPEKRKIYSSLIKIMGSDASE